MRSRTLVLAAAAVALLSACAKQSDEQVQANNATDQMMANGMMPNGMMNAGTCNGASCGDMMGNRMGNMMGNQSGMPVPGTNTAEKVVVNEHSEHHDNKTDR